MGDSRLILSDLGLYIFFTISGYLVYKSLVSSDSYLNFLWKRFLRIIPALTVVNMACKILGLFLTNLTSWQYLTNIETWRYLIINFSLVANQFHLPGVFTSLADTSVNASIWTILVEVKFYLALMLGQMVGITKNRWILLCCFISMQILSVYFSIHNVSIPGINTDIYFTFGSYFFMRVLFACFPKLLNVKWIFPVILLAVPLIIDTPINLVLISLSLPYFILKAGLSKPLFGIHKADYSYGLYLYAFPVQQTIIIKLGSNIPVFMHVILSTVIAMVFAILSWYYIEKPALKKKGALAL